MAWVPLWSGPLLSCLSALLQAYAPEHVRGSDRQLVQILALNGIALALIAAGAVVLVAQS